MHHTQAHSSFALSALSAMLILLLISLSSSAQENGAASDEQTRITIRTVPTIECCSVYLEGISDPATRQTAYRIEYKQTGESAWHQAHPLSASANDPTPRGSLFGLKPNTGYAVRALDVHGNVLAESSFQTWADQQPVAETKTITHDNHSPSAIVISDRGTPQAWIRYTLPAGDILQAGTAANEAILIKDAEYIILENMTMTGGRCHGILLQNSKNIVIRNCDISGYGRIGEQRLDKDGKYYDQNERSIGWDAGIRIHDSSRLLIENNYIHDPRGRANSWFYSHPSGPNAIFIRSTEGQLVIRNNDFIGSDAHRWNDVIEAWGNGDFDGGLNRDCDVYGNFLAFANDDGIELDGGQCNVRFWNNKIEGGLCGLSTAANVHGPSFIYDNLFVNLSDDRGAVGTVFKNGGGDTYTRGISYFYHNTAFTRGNGIMSVGYGKDKNGGMFYGISRNNLFAISGNGIQDQFSPEQNDFDYDTFTTLTGRVGGFYTLRPMEKHGVTKAVRLTDPQRGIFTQKASDPTTTTDVIPGLPITRADGSSLSAGCTAVQSHGNFPVRHLPFSVDAQQIILTCIGATGCEEQSVTITPADATMATEFKILKNDAFDWLHITPESATIASGQNVVLRVSADERALPPTGFLPGAFVIKLTDGLSLPISVYIKRARFQYLASANTIDCAGADAFSRGPSADGHNGECLWFEPVNARILGDKKIVWAVDLPQDGDYYLYLRIQCPDPSGSHDSLFMGINDEPAKQVGLNPGNQWHWSPVVGQTRSLPLHKGKNTFTFHPRETIWFDKILVTTVPFHGGDNIDAAVATKP